MKILFHKNFKKTFKKLRKKEQKKIKEHLVIFMKNQFNPLLNNHSLQGKYKGYRSINITGDLRAIYKFLEKDECIFIVIDNHSNLYS